MSTWGSFSKKLQQVGSILETLDQTAAKSVEKYRAPQDSAEQSAEVASNGVDSNSDQALLHTLNGLIDKPIKGAKGLGQNASSSKLSSMGTTSQAKAGSPSGNLEANIDDIFASMATQSGPPKSAPSKPASLQGNSSVTSPPTRTRVTPKPPATVKGDNPKKVSLAPPSTERKATNILTASSLPQSEAATYEEPKKQSTHEMEQNTCLPDSTASTEYLPTGNPNHISDVHLNDSNGTTDDPKANFEKESPQISTSNIPIPPALSDAEKGQEDAIAPPSSAPGQTLYDSEQELNESACQEQAHQAAPKDFDLIGLQSEIASLRDSNNRLSHQLNAVNKELESKSMKFKQTQIRLTELGEEVSSLRSVLHEKESQLSQKISSDKEVQKQLSTRDSQIATLQLKMKQAVEALKLRDETLEALESERESIKKDHMTALAAMQQTIASMKASYKQIEAELESERREHQQSRSRTSEREIKLENEVLSLNRTVAQYQRSLDEKNVEIIKLEAMFRESDTEAKKWKQDLADYKVKANKALQAKEKEIERLLNQQNPELSASPKASSDSTLAMLNQLEDLTAKLHDSLATNNELASNLRDAEAAVAELSEWKSRATEMEKEVEQERTRSEDLHAQLEQVAEELKKSREECTRLKISATNNSVTHSQEIQKLQKQLDSIKASDRSEATRELESRLRTTTDHLVSRQAQLEKVQSEKVALQLKLESEYRKRELDASENEQHHRNLPLSQNHQPIHVRVDVSQENNLRARNIVYLADIPHDASPLSRNISQAARALDQVGIQIGLFLRRYPLYRVAVLCYFLLLHLWVFFILSTSSPSPSLGSERLHQLP